MTGRERVMDVERIVGAWAELEEAKAAGRAPDWARVPGLTLEERASVAEFAFVVTDAFLHGVSDLRVSVIEAALAWMRESWAGSGPPPWLADVPDEVMVAAFSLFLIGQRMPGGEWGGGES